jgi:lysozyme family protein
MSFLSRIFGKKSGVGGSIGGSTVVRESITPNYPLLWSTCKIDENRIGECNQTIKKYWIPNKDKYLTVEKLTGVPAWVVFCLHYKEASCSFKGALHNGDNIIGNGKKTYNEPKGRGPFSTWEQSATDALLIEKNKFPFSWVQIAPVLEFCEKYNGLGHRKHGELSPYVWAYTNNHDETGNYVSDGKYSSSAPIKSEGVASLLLTMVSLGEIKLSSDKQYQIQ